MTVITEHVTRELKGVTTGYDLFTYRFTHPCGHDRVCDVPFHTEAEAAAHERWAQDTLCTTCHGIPDPVEPVPRTETGDDDW